MALSEKELNLIRSLKDELEHHPTDGQDKFIHAISKMLHSPKDRCALLLRGYAGTGKTTVVGALVKTLKSLKMKVSLLAPTGRAAKVLSSFAKTEALTIHKKIYIPKVSKHGGRFFQLTVNKHRNTLFIVDEASMIGDGSTDQTDNPRNLLDDLIEYIFAHPTNRLLLIGDSAQLPPVGLDISPALDLNYLRSSYYLTIAQIEFTEVVRQALNSGILQNATFFRDRLKEVNPTFPQLETEGYTDIVKIDGTELHEALEHLYDKYSSEGVMLITRSNKRANQFNAEIRNRILWREEEINAGDQVMVVKNNYHWLSAIENSPTSFIANGDILEVLSLKNFKELYGFRFATAEVQMLDFPSMAPFDVILNLDTLSVDSASIPYEKIRNLYAYVAEDYMHLGDKRAITKAVMKDPYYNALQVKFSYAVTCHKSQGGQWPAIIIDQGFLTEEMIDRSLIRWFYTGITRAVDELYLLNFHPKFFGEA